MTDRTLNFNSMWTTRLKVALYDGSDRHLTNNRAGVTIRSYANFTPVDISNRPDHPLLLPEFDLPATLGRECIEDSTRGL